MYTSNSYHNKLRYTKVIPHPFVSTNLPKYLEVTEDPASWIAFTLKDATKSLSPFSTAPYAYILFNHAECS